MSAAADADTPVGLACTFLAVCGAAQVARCVTQATTSSTDGTKSLLLCPCIVWARVNCCLQVLAAAFHRAAGMLWELLDAEAAAKAAQEAAAKAAQEAAAKAAQEAAAATGEATAAQAHHWHGSWYSQEGQRICREVLPCVWALYWVQLAATYQGTSLHVRTVHCSVVIHCRKHGCSPPPPRWPYVHR
jgi:hypothetical protein